MTTSKEKFIQAVLMATRLDDKNEYIIGAVEILISRLEAKEYSRFLAYIGERNSDYEKPMENIAKGVQEFIDLKEIPTIDYAKKMAIEIRQLFLNMKSYYSDIEKFNEFLLFDKYNKIFIELKTASDNERVFSDEVIEIIFSVGLDKIASQLDKNFIDEEPTGDFRMFYFNISESFVFQYLTRNLTRSVSDRILIQADKKKELTLLEIKNKAKQIGQKND